MGRVLASVERLDGRRPRIGNPGTHWEFTAASMDDPRRRLLQPQVLEEPGERRVIAGPRRFRQVATRVFVVDRGDVSGRLRPREDHDRDRGEVSIALDPDEDVASLLPGQTEVEGHEVRS